MEQKCSTPACPSTEVETVTVERVDQPDPQLRQYSYGGFCPNCRGERAGSFFLRGDDMTVENMLNAAQALKGETELG
jgi:hypothetical protein